MPNRDGLARRQLALFQALEPAVTDLSLSAAGESPAAAPATALSIELQSDSGARLGRLDVFLEGVAPTAASSRLAPAVECLRQDLAAADASARAIELKLLRLANELDIEFGDDVQMERALAAVAKRAGAEMAWLSAPRCGLTVQSAPTSSDPAVTREVEALSARVSQLNGQLRRPLAINGQGARPERSATCRRLIVPLFLGRARHPAWLVLASPLSAAPIGGWQMLPAMTLGQAVARRLELDLDRRTGLFNRGGLESAMRRSPSGSGSLVLIDIDRLHAINQMVGLVAGDDAILALAHSLAPPVLPPNAIVARLAGGGFALLLPGLTAEEAAEVAAQVQTAASTIVPGTGSGATPLTVSCGVVEIDNFRAPFDRFAVEGDFVLKLAKDRGRSRIEIHTSGNSSLIRRHDEVLAAADLREALRAKQIVLFAQKIISLRDPSAAPGFELLIRMRDANGEVRAPGEFIAAAQRYQLLPMLDRYVVDRAFEMLAPHRALLTRMAVSMSINVSGASVGDEGFVDHFVAQLRASKIPPGIITVELTEQAAVTNLEQASKMMRRLRDVGCGIALDDFGTGANSLTNLRSLPITRIKIDGSFVKDLLIDRRCEAAVRGILQLSRSFSLDTVAEYVESEALVTKLRELGVDKAQGHLFGKPEPLEQVMEKLAADEFSDLRGMLQIG
ncbi:MAG: GGDEF domain-containing phosphodiesterase, partial [Steroidobacteraceae bacterium]